MAFAQRINAEVIYYRTAESFFRKAFMAMRDYTYDSNYALDEEKRETITIPCSKGGFSSAILALINWGCCLESTTNLIICDIIRRKYSNNDLGKRQEREMRNLLKDNIRRRLDYINNNVGEIISPDLLNDISKLTKARNEFVHFDDEMKFCGGNLLLPSVFLLSKENMIFYRKTLLELMSVYRRNKILIIDPVDEKEEIYADGNYMDVEGLSRLRQMWYIIKHPIWYLFVRIPRKRQERRYRRMLVSELAMLE